MDLSLFALGKQHAKNRLLARVILHHIDQF